LEVIALAQDLEREVGIPVLDAVIAAGLFAWHFTRGSI
jgi:Asp/Glu/hydantoin racemase